MAINLIRTGHICDMLAEARLAAVEAQRLDAEENRDLPRPEGVRPSSDATRLLLGAAINSLHAAAESLDELFRSNYGQSAYKVGRLGPKLPWEWAVEKKVRVHDPDGWRSTFTLEGKTYEPRSVDDPISEEEFDARLSVSTVRDI